MADDKKYKDVSGQQTPLEIHHPHSLSLHCALPFHRANQGGAKRCWAICDHDASGPHGFHLGIRVALAARDDCAGMAHAAAGGER